VNGRGEVSGLEFDRSTGVGSERRLDTIRIYNGPGSIKSDNHEGIAIDSTDNCVNGRRRFFLTTDDGKLWSLMQFRELPCAG